ncbi:MAG: hypothetical protein ACI4JX_04050 [Oscillospiraceae bacterium]
MNRIKNPGFIIASVLLGLKIIGNVFFFVIPYFGYFFYDFGMTVPGLELSMALAFSLDSIGGIIFLILGIALALAWIAGYILLFTPKYKKAFVFLAVLNAIDLLCCIYLLPGNNRIISLLISAFLIVELLILFKKSKAQSDEMILNGAFNQTASEK